MSKSEFDYANFLPAAESVSHGPRHTRADFGQILDLHKRHFPGDTINLSHISRQLNVSRERIRQLYNSLAKVSQLPPIFRGSVKEFKQQQEQQTESDIQKQQARALLEAEVLSQRRIGRLGDNQIAANLNISTSTVTDILRKYNHDPELRLREKRRDSRR